VTQSWPREGLHLVAYEKTRRSVDLKTALLKKMTRLDWKGIDFISADVY